MNYLKLSTLAFLLFISSCSNEDHPINNAITKKNQRTLEIKEIRNIYAPYYDMSVHPVEKILTEEFVKFDFETGKVTKDGDNWDIGFKGKKVIINGGSKTKPNNEPERTQDVSIAIIKDSFDEIKNVPKDAFFKKDKKDILAIPTGSDNGWYSFNGASHIMSVIPNKIFILKTRLGKYVKMQILSYYKDSQTNNPSSYYSFNYVINPSENDTTLY